MFRISLLVAAMILISQAPEDSGSSLLPYKDYAMALLVSLLIKPWVVNQYR